jgi:hypothetical protein
LPPKPCSAPIWAPIRSRSSPITGFILRWQREVTFHEVRAHLGVQTQRQWSERAILRTTPALLGLFSVVTLLAHAHRAAASPAGAPHPAAWDAKTTPTVSDALALVRRRWWTSGMFLTSPYAQDRVKVPRALVDHLTALLCYAA